MATGSSADMPLPPLSPAWTMPTFTTASSKPDPTLPRDNTFENDLQAGARVARTIQLHTADLAKLKKVVDDQVAAGHRIPRQADQGNQLCGGDNHSTPLGSRSIPEASQVYSRLTNCHDNFVSKLNSQLAQLKRAADVLKMVAEKYATVDERDRVGAKEIRDALGQVASKMKNPGGARR